MGPTFQVRPVHDPIHTLINVIRQKGKFLLALHAAINKLKLNIFSALSSWRIKKIVVYKAYNFVCTNVQKAAHTFT